MERPFTRQYLIQLAHEHLDFRIPELESVCGVTGMGNSLHEIWDKTVILSAGKNRLGTNVEELGCTDTTTPYIMLKNVCESDVIKISQRSMFAKHAYHVWGHGETYSDLKSSLQLYPQSQKKSYMDKDSSFCIRVKASGRKLSLAEQIAKIDNLEDVLPFKGAVNLDSPKNEFHIIEDYGAHTGKKKTAPRYVFFGRLIADGQRNLIHSFSIKKRKFIGNTSMEAGLSFVMSNLAKVKNGDYVCDPFVGTGSLLIAAAYHGAYVTGGDINYNILHARGKSSRVGAGYRQKDETIYNSLMQYRLQDMYVDTLVHDAAKHPWRCSKWLSEGIFDAIVTDPPYGIRESCSKVGTLKNNISDISSFDVHHPERTAYYLDHVFTDLLTFASLSLVPGGRLVFWIPIYRPEYKDAFIPKHPSMKLLYNCEQLLKKDLSRRLIVMEKVCGECISESKCEKSVSLMYSGHNAFRVKYFNKITDNED